MKPEDIEITEEIASRIEIFVRLTEVEHEAYKGRQPMTQDLFNSISKKIAPINTDLWIEFISNYAAFCLMIQKRKWRMIWNGTLRKMQNRKNRCWQKLRLV